MPYGGNPSASFSDAVRFLLGDTDPAVELIRDSEIDYLSTRYGSTVPERIAALAARTLGHRYAHRATQSIGRVSVQWGDLSAKMLALAEDLENRMGLDATPFVAGVRQSQIDAEVADTDRPQPCFAVGMHDATDQWEDEHYGP